MKNRLKFNVIGQIIQNKFVASTTRHRKERNIYAKKKNILRPQNNKEDKLFKNRL